MSISYLENALLGMKKEIMLMPEGSIAFRLMPSLRYAEEALVNKADYRLYAVPPVLCIVKLQFEHINPRLWFIIDSN